MKGLIFGTKGELMKQMKEEQYYTYVSKAAQTISKYTKMLMSNLPHPDISVTNFVDDVDSFTDDVDVADVVDDVELRLLEMIPEELSSSL